MFKVPQNIIEESKSVIQSLVYHIKVGSQSEKAALKRIKRAKEYIKILELNYGV